MDQKELMQNVKDYRKQHDIFKKSLDQRSEKFQITTYDGPPFASGSPHFGHGLVGAMKDALLRYKTMKGYKVNRDRGWDCHGLPVEKFVEKKLGLDGKKDIEEKLGVEKFVEECRKSVGTTADEWKIFVDSIGRWADMDHAYYTMDLGYMESVLRVFQTMYNQNLVYKGFKVQRCCPSCATTLANNEVNEGYKDRQDPAITIKFRVTSNEGRDKEKQYEKTEDGFIQVADCIIKRDGKILMTYHNKGQKYVCPGGKVETGHTLEATAKKEIKEELDVEVTSIKKLGSFKEIIKGTLRNLNILEIEITGEPQNMEPEKHPQMIRAEIIPSDNTLGFAVKIEETVVDDDFEIMNQFYDLYVYHHKIAQQVNDEKADVNVLAWTTTPRTLPSNMFLAVGKYIHYYMVFDKTSKEYFVLAENLVKQYYKNADEYILINILQGEDLVGLSYEPLFPFIMQSRIDAKYKKQFFKIIPAEFVSTEDGTGIVHIAPGFGMEDFDAVAQFLPREDSKNRLFMPVNDYGEFTDEVPDRKGQSVFEVNKEVITRLKDEKKLIGQRSYNHSYPHCRRCDTPLISKAVTSRFIKEPELTKITVPNAEKIGFVPESVKNRFVDTLQSAPDRNLSRNRYRGAPLPIRENQDAPEERIIVGTLDELYQRSKTGSKNLTKNILMRHGKTDYNEDHRHDFNNATKLNAAGLQQAQDITKQLSEVVLDDFVVVVSPLTRTWETAVPFLKTFLKADELSTIEKKYLSVQKEYQKLCEAKKIQEYIQNSKEKNLYKLHEKVYVDMRITDIIVPELQDNVWPRGLTTSMPTSQKLTPLGESIDNIFARAQAYIHEINALCPTQTIITISHEDTIVAMAKAFRNFDYLKHKKEYDPANIQMENFYRDTERKTEVDLHKPYVDNYRFMKDGHIYKRVSEVMDCRFESGSMPFGQANYTGVESPSSQKSVKSKTGGVEDLQTLQTKTAKQFVYPAEFIIEGLDQTRGRFRTLHVCGNAVMKGNSFNNVVINGLILAEDGKKMSKSLRNYPDPTYIFEKYGTDAYRLYLLASAAVRAEPMRFSEKGVDQIYKDFTSAIINAYKFFETYAKVDNFVYDKPRIYFLRHGEANKGTDPELTKDSVTAMQDPAFIERVLRVNPDVIYSSPLLRAQQTAQRAQEIMKTYRGKDIKIIIDKNLEEGPTTMKSYETIMAKEGGKNVLMISHEPNFQVLRSALYQEDSDKIGKLECVQIPSYPISNELDKWIWAALNEVGLELEKTMDAYALDGGAKIVLSFIDKLNNRFIRRSRRRFRAGGMDADKISAYHTLFEVLETYMKMCAPFAPFISEHIYLELQSFKAKKAEGDVSVHLEHLPLSNEKYINRALLDEIAIVRRVISLGLFIRSKNKIAVKQPLSSMEIKM